MSLEKFRSIPEDKKPKKLNIPIREAKTADGNRLIPHGVYLFPMEWSGKRVMQQVTVFRNLSSPLIL